MRIGNVQRKILQTLIDEDHGHWTSSELSDHLGINRGSVTRALAKLLERGYIEKRTAARPYSTRWEYEYRAVFTDVKAVAPWRTRAQIAAAEYADGNQALAEQALYLINHHPKLIMRLVDVVRSEDG